MPEGEPNHTVGLLIACRALTVFTVTADAAGPSLDSTSFAAALDGIGEFTLPGKNAASLGAGKFDAEDDLRLSVHNPDAAEDEADFVEFR